MTSKPLRKNTVIADSTVLSLARDPELVRLFPALGQLKEATKRRGCSKCGRGRTQSNDQLNNVKMSMAAMSAEARQKIKAKLNTERITVKFKDASGNVAEINF